MNMTNRVAIVSALGISATTLGSEVLVDNGDPSGGFGTDVLSELSSINQVGDGFELATSVVVQSVEWWGVGSGDDFRLRVFETAGGAPGNQVVVSAGLSGGEALVIGDAPGLSAGQTVKVR